MEQKLHKSTSNREHTDTQHDNITLSVQPSFRQKTHRVKYRSTEHRTTTVAGTDRCMQDPSVDVRTRQPSHH